MNHHQQQTSKGVQVGSPTYRLVGRTVSAATVL